jgi:hypothetical protein
VSTDPPPQPPRAPVAPAAPPPPAPVYAPQDSRPQSGLAVTAFVLGLIAFVLPAVVCALVALRRIKRRNLRGRGFAIAGLVLSALWTVAIAAIVVLAVSTDTERDASGRIVDGGSLNVFDLRDGDCLNDLGQTEEAMSVDAVPCAQPHDAQVYAVVQLPGREYPGDDAVVEQSDRECGRRFPPEARREGEVYSFYPTRDSWEARDDREVTCIALFRRPRPGSLE